MNQKKDLKKGKMKRICLKFKIQVLVENIATYKQKGSESDRFLSHKVKTVKQNKEGPIMKMALF